MRGSSRKHLRNKTEFIPKHSDINAVVTLLILALKQGSHI